MNERSSPTDEAESPDPSLAGQRTIDRRTRAVARIILGKRTVTDPEVQAWLEERMAFSQQSADLRRQALEAANAIVDEALTRSSRISRLRQARLALRICPECARAYVVLGNLGSKNEQQAHDLFRLGMRAAERALGRQAMKRWAGRFGEIPDTRDYMDTRLGLANALWLMDRQHEALPHYRELLALDPVDTAGVRFILLFYSIAMFDSTLTEELLTRYPDDTYAEWLYSTALYRYRRDGDRVAARRVLREALEANRHIAVYLLRKEMPTRDQRYPDDPGTEGEAMVYVDENDALWDMTPGAREWLERVFNALPADGSPR
jgi:tetratricopeptide (TPR) repeat protein